MNTFSISILVPAYNEEANINLIVTDLLRQEKNNFKISEIVVYSDGSTDHTNEKVKVFSAQGVRLIEGAKRSGKAKCVNAYFKTSNSDCVIVIDADTRIFDKNFIQKIVKPIIEAKADLVSASPLEFSPDTFAEKVIYASMRFKKKIYRSIKNGNNIYTCYGYARAFSKNLYSSIVFPESIGEDAYSFLYAKFHKFAYKYQKSANIYYKLPSSFRDHQKQSIRFFHSQTRFNKEFGEVFVSKQYEIPFTIFLKVFIFEFVAHPILSFYFLVVLAMKLKSFTSPVIVDTWSIASSSKKRR